MKVSDLTLEELKALIKEAVREEIEGLLEDPDKELELKEDILEEIKASLASKERIPVEDVAKELGLKW
ncbi:MAG TPA: hypothetical protein ACFYD3_05585 [Candidatus Hypogeohydataceae bacterium YC41]